MLDSHTTGICAALVLQQCSEGVSQSRQHESRGWPLDAEQSAEKIRDKIVDDADVVELSRRFDNFAVPL